MIETRELTIDAAPGISFEDLPQGIIDEFNDNYDKVEWALDENINHFTRSYRLEYRQVSDVIQEMEVVIPGAGADDTTGKPYTTTTVKGFPAEVYIARLEYPDENNNRHVIVRRVLSAGPICVNPDEVDQKGFDIT